MWIKEQTFRSNGNRQIINRSRLKDIVLTLLDGTDDYGLVFQGGNVFYQNPPRVPPKECECLAGPNSAPPNFSGLICCFIYKDASIQPKLILQAEEKLKEIDINGRPFICRCEMIDAALKSVDKDIEFALIYTKGALFKNQALGIWRDYTVAKKNIATLIKHLKDNSWQIEGCSDCHVMYHR